VLVHTSLTKAASTVVVSNEWAVQGLQSITEVLEGQDVCRRAQAAGTVAKGCSEAQHNPTRVSFGSSEEECLKMEALS